MVICLERGADLHMAQLIPLPLTVSCFSKIQIGFTFLVPTHPGSPGKKDVLVRLSFLSPPALGSITHVVVRHTTRRAIAMQDAGKQTNYLIPWTQASQLNVTN